MTDLQSVLTAFRDATRCSAALWTQNDDSPPDRVATSVPAVGILGWTPPFEAGPPRRVPSPSGPVMVAALPGPRRAWLVVGPCAPENGSDQIEAYLRFLLPVITEYLSSGLEVEHAANELAERYEEINLLYTITEILGRTLSLEEAAATILREISETVGARRGSILVHDRVTDTLQCVAALGAAAIDVPPIALDDPCSVSASVFRDRRATIAEEEPEAPSCAAESLYRHGTMLSVPIMWTAPSGGPEPLGVVNLSDRSGGQIFTAGDQKLITAIATQIGTAIQNSRLVRESLSQQRLVQELSLAHDLQMRLLPRTEIVAPEASVVARVIPAESVGGDFYNLFRLGSGRTGVMIGDVSSHGYRAALIMALAMSASAIHAQAAAGPGEMLSALLGTLREELAVTEMFITTFYGVIDHADGVLRYANAGHPYAYHVAADGSVERLGAMDAPLGMVESVPSSHSRPWSHDDLLLLFTDGVSDARNRFGVRLGETAVLDVVREHRSESPAEILERVFDLLEEHTGEAVQNDDIAVVLTAN
ncbi:MAG TPA: GAF domain-containing SpoIIE family protein phosphatase [Gemmatimonadaceae bacterium]|nr:GAF domain-containing SpoIIE family protein phosphatase [Gemmatimonadaceae bacterium]